MDEAAFGIAAAVTKFFHVPGRCIVFAGKGNNAGDALAAAALLHERGWEIDLRLAFSESECGELPRKKFARLRAALERPTGPAASVASPTIILDGLLGVGATPPLREPVRAACREINRLHQQRNAFVFAVDVPSGLDSDSGDADADCVVADFTLAVAFAKRGLVADRALDRVGRIEIVPLGALQPLSTATSEVIVPGSFPLPRRRFGAYKNQFGRIGVVAGSTGLTGAAILCTTGALRAGGGLVEVFVPEEIYPIIAAAAPPEAMVKPVGSYKELAAESAIDVWAVGPGLGREHAHDVLQLIDRSRMSMVLDADALNSISADTALLNRAAGPRLITPHPGEMKRLFPRSDISRAEHARQFCAAFPAITLLLKGSRTIIAQHGCATAYNTTGNPGMATGGMGDVLTGVCAALIARGLPLFEAASVGAWVCGRAAEIALFNDDVSEESLLPSDVLAHLGAAFNEWRS